MSTAVDFKHRLEVQERLRNQGAFAILYNGSAIWQLGRHSGQRYHMPPEGIALNPATGRRETFDGTLKITDLYRPNKADMLTWREACRQGRADPRRPPTSRDRVATAQEIALHIAGKLVRCGITVLTNQDIVNEETGEVIRTKAKENERLKAEAREIWEAAEQERCESVIRRQHARTVGMAVDDPERRYRAEEIEAEKFLAKRAKKKRIQEESGDVDRFYCKFECGFNSFEQADLAEHYEFRHADKIAKEEADAPPQKGKSRLRESA